MTVPMPATWAPDRVIVSICQAADPLRPPDWYGFQLPPVADTHRATSCWPGGPNRPAAVKPAASAVRAVKLVSGPGELNGTCCQVAPPSVDSSANGTAPGSVPVAEPTAGPFPIVPWPRATTRLPLTATCWSAPADAPPGGGMTIVFHDRPSVVIHAAGWLLCEPTETNPCAVAATASTWLEPVARFTSCARVLGDVPPGYAPDLAVGRGQHHRSGCAHGEPAGRAVRHAGQRAQVGVGRDQPERGDQGPGAGRGAPPHRWVAVGAADRDLQAARHGRAVDLHFGDGGPGDAGQRDRPD